MDGRPAGALVSLNTIVPPRTRCRGYPTPVPGGLFLAKINRPDTAVFLGRGEWPRRTDTGFENHSAPANSKPRVPHLGGRGSFPGKRSEQRSSNLDDSNTWGAKAICSRSFHRIPRGAWGPSSSTTETERKTAPPARQAGNVLCKGHSIAMFAIDLKTRGVEVLG